MSSSLGFPDVGCISNCFLYCLTAHGLVLEASLFYCMWCVCIHKKSATSSLSVSQGPYDDMEICSAQPYSGAVILVCGSSATERQTEVEEDRRDWEKNRKNVEKCPTNGIMLSI